MPAVINGSRKRRIATGSGTQIQDVNRLLKQFKKMQKMMKKLSGKGGMKKNDARLGWNGWWRDAARRNAVLIFFFNVLGGRPLFISLSTLSNN